MQLNVKNVEIEKMKKTIEILQEKVKELNWLNQKLASTIEGAKILDKSSDLSPGNVQHLNFLKLTRLKLY